MLCVEDENVVGPAARRIDNDVCLRSVSLLVKKKKSWTKIFFKSCEIEYNKFHEKILLVLALILCFLNVVLNFSRKIL